MDAVGLDEFRALFRSVPSAVAVVATRADDHVHATTVSAFSSLSAEPPLVMMALERSSDLLAALRGSRSFGLNVLAVGQEELALRCAAKGREKLPPEAWDPQAPQPRLPDAAAWCECSVTDLLEGGDHIIVVALVNSSQRSDRGPLVYQDHAFHALSSVER